MGKKFKYRMFPYANPNADNPMKITTIDLVDSTINRNLQPLMEGLNIGKQQMFGLCIKNQIKPVEDNSYESFIINGYFDNTIEDHYKYYGNNYKPVIDNIWSINRPKDVEQYQKLYYNQKESTLLWHGTILRNVVSILNNGFRQPDKPGLLGPGIYFADRAIKSLMYTKTRPPNRPVVGVKTGYFFVCQVATGKILKISDLQSFNDTPQGYDSVKALGIYQNDTNDVTYLDNIAIPWGNARPQPTNTGIRYNEYVVYTNERILIKYLVKFTWQYIGD